MAQRTVVTITDDIDGSPDAEEVRFSINGVDWAIDLGPANKKTFTEAWADWTEHAHRVTASSGTRRRRARKDTADVRAWAREQGHQVSERGRIPASIQAEYDAAH